MSFELNSDQLAATDNETLLAILDQVLLEFDRRLTRYAQVGHEVPDMADEGLLLALRSLARLAQTQSAAQHAQQHLQIVGVGGWRPQGLRPTWSADSRVSKPEVAVQPWWRDYAAAAMSGVRAGGSHAPVVNSWVIASRVSRPHLVAVDR